MSEERVGATGDGSAAGRRVRMLLADDDDTVRFLLRELLESSGAYDVAAVARDGQEAVEIALQVQPEVVVLDLAMPRLSGLEAAAELRRLLPDCRIVIHSSYSAAMMGQQAIDAGADVYVEKRIRPDHLLAALAGLFPSGKGLPAAAPSPTAPQQRHTPVRSREDALLDALNPHHVGVVFTDAGGRVTSANAAAADLLGVPAHEIAGRTLADQLSGTGPTADPADPLVTALTTGTSRSGVELDLVRPDGSRTRLSVSVRPLPDPRSSRPSGVVAVLEEITGR